MNVRDFLIEHLHDLAEESFEKGTAFSSFLSLDEQHLFVMHRIEFSYVPYGFNHEEDYLRRMLFFGEKKSFPLTVLKAKVENTLSHRDVLGAYMNLGLDRSTLGNIKVTEKEVFIEVLEHVAPLVMREFTSIRREKVNFSFYDGEVDFRPRMKEVEIISSTNRLDGILSSLYKLSRQDAKDLVDKGKVLVLGKTAKNTLSLEEGDVVSVRGFGKFLFEGLLRETKKERQVLLVYEFS